jgi:hypothetical protein
VPELTLAAAADEAGLYVQIGLSEPVEGGALCLSVTGAAGRLLAQERLHLPPGAVVLAHRLTLADTPLRLKGVLLAGDEVVTQQRVDLHISLAAFES